jgi:hypothetical protein
LRARVAAIGRKSNNYLHFYSFEVKAEKINKISTSLTLSELGIFSKNYYKHNKNICYTHNLSLFCFFPSKKAKINSLNKIKIQVNSRASGTDMPSRGKVEVE